jgi:hypothetical protein
MTTLSDGDDATNDDDRSRQSKEDEARRCIVSVGRGYSERPSFTRGPTTIALRWCEIGHGKHD